MQSDDLKETKITGKMTLHFTHHETFDIGDVGYLVVSLRKSDGTNISTGRHERFPKSTPKHANHCDSY